MMVLAGVPEAAELSWRDAFDEERDRWMKAAHGAVRERRVPESRRSRDGNFAVWLVPVSEPDDDLDDDA